MRKKAFYMMVMAMLFVLVPGTVSANETPPVNHVREKTDDIPEEIKIMIDRIHEIKDMDKSDLSRSERKELRKEVRTIKKAVRGSGNGIYISSGAIIIILLLIIIL
ncbi:hypothetical protein GSB9_01827 [Flavobacteriaceae bacterium GSB9]|nr:hypothetical protein GSB9_01827 [Flavobacteriaceae bacterium GSB9]